MLGLLWPLQSLFRTKGNNFAFAVKKAVSLAIIPVRAFNLILHDLSES